MAVLFNKDKNELIVCCKCGCDAGMHIIVEPIEGDYAYVSYLNGNFYTEQNRSFLRVFADKAKRIWAIIRNKDYCYSDIIMDTKDWGAFKEFVNSQPSMQKRAQERMEE